VKDCPNDHDVCIGGKCVPCGYNPGVGAGLACKCKTCDGTQCGSCG
jgi:hypothetical protein